MAISNNSTGLRPGVCTSTTRPTAPYEGFMIYETDTDLTYVWGGSAWQQVSGGTAVGNSGLVFVKSQTIGSGVSTIIVTDAFSATYDNYRVVYSGGQSSSLQDTLFWLGSTVPINGYYGSFVHGVFSSGSAVNAGQVNTANLRYMGVSASGVMSIAVEVNSPFLSVITTMAADCIYTSTGGFSGRTTGFINSSASFTTCSIAPASGTFTGGAVTVYGYRKA